MLFPGWLLETGQGVLQRLHLREREQKRERGLGALVLAQPIHVQTVAAATGGRIVKGESQIVAAEKPLKGTPRFRDPEGVARGLIGFDAGRNRGLGFYRLLIEERAFLSSRIKSIRTNGPKGARVRS